jgi:hypothetical protein
MDTVRYQPDGHVATITYDRPEALNTIDGRMRADLNTAFGRFRDEEDGWVAIATGPAGPSAPAPICATRRPPPVHSPGPSGSGRRPTRSRPAGDLKPGAVRLVTLICDDGRPAAPFEPREHR